MYNLYKSLSISVFFSVNIVVTFALKSSASSMRLLFVAFNFSCRVCEIKFLTNYTKFLIGGTRQISINIDDKYRFTLKLCFNISSLSSFSFNNVCKCLFNSRNSSNSSSFIWKVKINKSLLSI